jgi:hypothetical protein
MNRIVSIVRRVDTAYCKRALAAACATTALLCASHVFTYLAAAATLPEDPAALVGVDGRTASVLTEGSSKALLIVPSAITITPGSLPGGVVGTPYSQSFSASGGSAPYVFSNEVGRLPNVLTLTPAGSLSGTPQEAATVPFEIWATDADGRESRVMAGTSLFTVPLSLATGLAQGTVGQSYGSVIAVSGGSPPYTCVLTSGSLPLGISLLPNCSLSGTPLTAGTYTFAVQITDGAVGIGNQGVTLLILPAPPPIPAISRALLALLSLLLIIAGAIATGFSRKAGRITA